MVFHCVRTRDLTWISAFAPISTVPAGNKRTGRCYRQVPSETTALVGTHRTDPNGAKRSHGYTAAALTSDLARLVRGTGLALSSQQPPDQETQ